MLQVQGSKYGWDVEVYDDRRPAEGNLLYQSRKWHGPYPTQIDPWSIKVGLFPRERWLAVRRHPWLVGIICNHCTTSGDGQGNTFNHGVLRIRWKKSKS